MEHRISLSVEVAVLTHDKNFGPDDIIDFVEAVDWASGGIDLGVLQVVGHVKVPEPEDRLRVAGCRFEYLSMVHTVVRRSSVMEAALSLRSMPFVVTTSCDTPLAPMVTIWQLDELVAAGDSVKFLEPVEAN